MNVCKKVIITESILIITVIVFGWFYYSGEVDRFERESGDYQKRFTDITDQYNHLQEQNNRLNTLTRKQQRELTELTERFNRTRELAEEIGTGLEEDEDVIQRAIDTISRATELVQYIIENY